MPHPLYAIDTAGQLEPFLQREWLLTNGIGGFAASTVVGCNTRRYHGLLCGATNPPVGRIMALNRVGELIFLDGKSEKTYELSINQFGQTFHPRGDRHLRRFEVNGVARWEYAVENVTIIKEVQLVWRKNIVGIRYTIKPAEHRDVELQILPFVSLRDFHALRSAASARFHVAGLGQQVAVGDDYNTLYIQADAGNFVQRGDWWYGHTYAIETERGQDDTEDLFMPGSFILQTATEASITLWAGLEPAGLRDWEEELSRRPDPTRLPEVSPRNLGKPRMPTVSATPSDTVRRLLRAAADFVVDRKSPDGKPGKTIVAGYPWFADWGRDTMISLPGLMLHSRRFDEAGDVLSIFAQHVSQGMIPNRFDDYTNEPSYNTVDASLWFIHTAHEYLRLSGDRERFDHDLRPACQEILQGYRQGTRYGIKMDQADGLISAGDAHTQLTWMDAKMNDVAFTPRQGKAVEINALWHNALKLMGEDAAAATTAASFTKAFWINPFRGLYDVVNGDQRDGSIRPNQIFAASLPFSPLTTEQQSAVVEVVRRELFTPMGLRTLAASDKNYRGRYTGNQWSRDSAYHNGTVWPWLMGPFLNAYLRAHRHSSDSIDQCRKWLQPLIDQMTNAACIGQISEIYDGDPPQRPVGCFAQAWSVAEVLRLAVELGM